jgi:regulator of sigma D
MFNPFKSGSSSAAGAPQGGRAPAVASAGAPAQFASAPGTEIRYSPTLIDDLKRDHRQLLTTYMAIKTSFDAGDYRSVSAKLNEFRIGLQGHLLTENVRFYIYLDRLHGQDEMNSDLIRGFRREMDGIGRAALNFLKKYDAIGVDQDLASAFAKDFAEIGAVLSDRIQREETVLYPLYMPPA